MSAPQRIPRPTGQAGNLPRPATRLRPVAVRTGAAPPDVRAKSAQATGERPKILFLDDEARIVNALAALFRYKYQVFTATSGPQALAIMRQYHVHVVVSDQRMPEMTGVEFLRQAKAVSPDSMRILLTGFSDLSAIIDSVNDGEVYRFLNKPWGNQEIQAVIADALAIGLALEADRGAGVLPPSVSGTPADAASGQPAILMMHDKRESFERLRPLLDASHPFYFARTVDECIDALHSKGVGVVVSDLQVGKRDTAELLKLLKQEHPHILTIVVADTADADQVVELINQAKIFRYVLAPYKPQKLKFFIESALAQLQRYKGSPTRLGEQKVEVSKNAPSRAGAAIRERLRALRSFFAPRSSAAR